MAASAGAYVRRLGALALTLLIALLLASSAEADGGGSWSPVASMSTSRINAVAAPLTDGRVLVAGGQEQNTMLASAEIYDPTANTWTPVAPMSEARDFAVAAALPGDRVLVAGGDRWGTQLSSAEIYNAVLHTWTPAAQLDTPRDEAAAAPLPDGRVLVVGGSGSPTTAEIYDSVTNTWTPAAAPLLRTIFATAAALGDGRVLVAGGEGDPPAGPPGSAPPPVSGAGAEIYDPSTNSWSVAASMASGRRSASATALDDGRVLITGGDPGLDQAGAEIFEPTANDWFPAAPMSTGRAGAASAPLPGGRVLVAGGWGDPQGYTPLATAETFSPPPAQHLTNLTAPQVQGDPIIGRTLTAVPGTWNADAPQLVYQWQRCARTCSNIGPPQRDDGGPIRPGYTLTSGDLGARIRVLETGSDRESSVVSTSPPSAAVSLPGIHLEWWTASFLTPGIETIPVVDDLSKRPATVHYRISQALPNHHPIFATISGVLRFEPGHSELFVEVPMYDAGVPILTPSLRVSLSQPIAAPLATPSTGSISISDPTAFTRVPGDPLGTTPAPSPADPLGGARFYADSVHSAAAHWAQAMGATDAGGSQALQTIANQPNTARFGPWNGAHPGVAVAGYLQRAASEQPGTVPMLSTYYLVGGRCGGWADPPPAQAAYHEWIKNFAEGIGTRPAVLFLEMDSLITVGCLSRQGVGVRMHELRDAIGVLSNVPHLVTYLDAGAADALSARTTARLLKQAGVGDIQGFFLNSTHFDWTSNEIRYGEAVSRMTGGKHFVVNTAENGRGPLVPRHRVRRGNEVLCDPPGRGLGPLPTWNTGFRNVDAFAWIANPGVSGGRCRPGAPPTGVFWPQLAIELVRNADYRVR